MMDDDKKECEKDIAILLRKLHNLFCDYYRVFEEEEASMSCFNSIVDIRREAMRDIYNSFVHQTLFWFHFFQVKSGLQM